MNEEEKMKKIFEWLDKHQYIATWLALVPLVFIAYSFINQPTINLPSPDRCILSNSLEDTAEDMCDKMSINDTLKLSDGEGFYEQENIDVLSAEIKKISDNACEVKCRAAYTVNIVESIGISSNIQT